MENLRLIKPTAELKEEYMDMLRDWKRNREWPIPWISNSDLGNFSLMVEKLIGYSKGIGLVGEQVEHSTYWLVNSENKILGTINIKHRLNEYLLKTGGNIGYGVRPSERKKGLASKMLKLALDITKNMGMKKVLVTCDEWNIASERTILKNGGVFETNEVEAENVVKRFWINL